MTLATHSAAGSAAGFSYQFERALYWLARSTSGAVIGVETDDDVSVREANGELILEQDKHSIQVDGEPFGDRRKDLWNTLAIWLEALDTNEVVAGKTLFLMVTNKTLPDCIAVKMGKAKKDLEIDTCIAQMEEVAKSPPEGIRAFVERVMRLASRSNLRRLIERSFCADNSQATSGEELRKSTIDALPFPEWCKPVSSSVVDELLGWMHRTTLSSWQQQKPAWIKHEHFINQFFAIVDLRKRKISRERSEHLIDVGDDKVSSERGNPFVKQLHLITDDPSEVNSAIRDFIRCNIEKARLSAEGNLTDEDWLSFETALLSRWAKIRPLVQRLNSNLSETDQGYKIYTDTTVDYREMLAGSPTEQVYLSAGTYHRLAGLMRVGWHPRYEELMHELMAV